ncbi:MAG: isocitrate/isopropylmalate dehydrogenase family protein [Terriglobales bacterium]
MPCSDEPDIAASGPSTTLPPLRGANCAQDDHINWCCCSSCSLTIVALINMTHKITLIPGDGIGPEVTQATVRILEATGVKFEWETFMAGAEAFEKYKEYIPKELTESIERTHVGLKGPVTTPIGGGFPSINVALRQKFELYANFRPIRNLPHIPTRYPDVDLIIVRENTESLYSGLEHEVVPGVVESLKIITEKASTRIARFAFEYARKNTRKKIHAIHKANIMKLSDGLFLRCTRAVAKDYPEIIYGEHIVDNTCMQLVMNPYQYDMLVMENLYGDIISDLCAAFVGGLGFVPSANLGDHCAIFEAVHGSAPDIAGKNLANPTAILRSSLLMLRHLGEYDAALKIRNALENVYRTRDKLTRDVGGKAGTSEFADFIIEAMESGAGDRATEPSQV